MARCEDGLEKYDKTEGARAVAVFRSIPSQLSHRNARFRHATVGKSARATNVRSALEHLRKSMMCNLCTNVTVPEVMLDLYENNSQFKLFMGDTGLLLTQVIRATPEAGEALWRGLIAGRLGANMGMIMENAVAQALVASGHGLHFHAFERTFEGKPVPYEVDFLLVRGNRVVPVKVKSSGHRRHAALDQFFDRYGVGRVESYVLTPKDLSREGNLTYVPLCMSMCLLTQAIKADLLIEGSQEITRCRGLTTPHQVWRYQVPSRRGCCKRDGMWRQESRLRLSLPTYACKSPTESISITQRHVWGVS